MTTFFKQNIVIPAGGSFQETSGAKVMTIQACTLPITVAFNGGPAQPAQAGTVLDQSPGGFDYATLSNPNAQAVTVSYACGDTAVQYQAGNNAVANAQTYAFGNLGIPVNTAAAGGLPACNANGFLQITNTMNLQISNLNNGGHRRQLITFTVPNGSAVGLIVTDPNGCYFMEVQGGQTIALATDAILNVSGNGGTCTCIIGQLFLSA